MSATSTVASYMAELKDVVAKLKDINAEVKELRDRKKELTIKILEYVESAELPGIKYQDLIVLKRESTTHTKKNKKDREESILNVLEQHGVNDPKQILHDVSKALVGEEKHTVKLQVKMSVPEIY